MTVEVLGLSGTDPLTRSSVRCRAVMGNCSVWQPLPYTTMCWPPVPLTYGPHQSTKWLWEINGVKCAYRKVHPLVLLCSQELSNENQLLSNYILADITFTNFAKYLQQNIVSKESSLFLYILSDSKMFTQLSIMKLNDLRKFHIILLLHSLK